MFPLPAFACVALWNMEPFWGTCDDEMRWCPFWSQLQTKHTVAEFFLDTKESHMMEIFLKFESLPSAYIVLQKSGSKEEAVMELSFGDTA